MAPNLGQDWEERLRSSKATPEISPTTQEAIDSLKRFYVVPCSDGGIQLEVHRDGFDIEIVIGADGRIESALVCAERLS